MKIKVSEATDIQLNWLVSSVLGQHPVMRHDHMRKKAADQNYTGDLAFHLSVQINEPITVTEAGVTRPVERYSTDWAQGGPIIDREHLENTWLPRQQEWYVVHKQHGTDGMVTACGFGPTLLIAAMRCYLARKLGDSVDFPDELLETTC